ncbi:hypothetical protein GE118_00410 [Mycoplasma sp. NEAQ87857]|uniref:hypothetical protein n=1 Tax=Mycoplasma sp. NEAQ87857 TaxID=2683967 RepID=UPI0013169492|nr:hypothetical protein [Mycoplasma sp. NEAQ87857]QGZ97266.1 hypothetical protein GE118_00410 [Mycoplasma sp. NEAQ87857]
MSKNKYYLKAAVDEYFDGPNHFNSFLLPTTILSLNQDPKNNFGSITEEELKDAKNEFLKSLKEKAPFYPWLVKSFSNQNSTYEDLIAVVDKLPNNLLEEITPKNAKTKEFYWPSPRLYQLLFQNIDQLCYKNQWLLRQEIAEQIEKFFVNKPFKNKKA